MSSTSPPRRKRSLSLTAVALNSPSSKQRYFSVAKSFLSTLKTNNWQGDWLADAVDSKTKFSGIELIDGEWYDYDEKAGEEVSIKDITWEIRRS